ncbi:MAG: Rne/Rng family ribonuclease [Candidatus Kapabacteria bacterium]|nr:Rne/Rng family ribonuclease [Candidatus Kapabacteria bacterium]
MSRRILINSTPTHVRIAITEDGRLAELFTEELDREGQVGNVYLGRVTKIIQGMNAAFINIGLDQDAFLHFSDVDQTMEEAETDDDDDDDRPATTDVGSADVALRSAKAVHRKRLPTFSTKRSGDITINLQEKQQVVVQVTRDAYAQKGVRVTTKVGMPGRNVVLLPFDDSIGVSRKIQSQRERRRLRSIAKAILPEGMGCIIRTAAEGLDEDDVRGDFEQLLETWHEMEDEVRRSKEPRRIYTEPGVTFAVIRDQFKDDVQQVVVDDRKLYREIKSYLKRTAPFLDGKVELHNESRPVFDAYGVERDVQLTHSRNVPLPSGGSIVIDHTEAMVVVDVNSGRASNEKSQEQNAVKSNFEAVREVARQLRLRDIGGIIAIDFIDMAQEENRRRLVNEMKRELMHDRAKTVVYPITPLGVLQITRQRIRRNIAERSSEDCPLCFGTGRVQSPETIVGSIDRWLRNYRARTWGLRVTVAVHPFVAHYIERHRGTTLRHWLRKHFLFVRLVEDDSVEAGEFKCFRPRSRADIARHYM